MQRKSSRFLIITTALALSACGSSTTSTASGGSDASIDSGPVGVQDTGIAAPTQFTCTSASKNAAGFSWQASPTPGVVGYVVERATLSGEFEAQPGVGGKTLTFADLTVTQFETYRYRVRAKVADKLGDSSNEVTVGAPAPGFHTAVGPGALATDVDLALDGNGDPAIVYVASDTPPAAVVFSNWNRKTAAWNAPVKITSDFLPNTSGGSPVAAIAFDHAGSSGTFAVVWASADGQQLDWALSSDAGKTWQQETIAVSPAGTSYAQPAIALGNSKAHVTWLQDGVRLFYATGTLSTPAKNWTADKEAPPAATADKLLPFAPSIALDAAQAPAIAYFSHGKDESVIATFWRPDEKNARTIQSSGGYADPSPSLSLAFKGQAPRAAVTLHQSPTTNAAVWFVTSSDGNSWGHAARSARRRRGVRAKVHTLGHQQQGRQRHHLRRPENRRQRRQVRQSQARADDRRRRVDHVQPGHGAQPRGPRRVEPHRAGQRRQTLVGLAESGRQKRRGVAGALSATYSGIRAVDSCSRPEGTSSPARQDRPPLGATHDRGKETESLGTTDCADKPQRLRHRGRQRLGGIRRGSELGQGARDSHGLGVSGDRVAQRRPLAGSAGVGNDASGAEAGQWRIQSRRGWRSAVPSQ